MSRTVNLDALPDIDGLRRLLRSLAMLDAPEGPALALLRIAARHPRIIRENLVSAA